MAAIRWSGAAPRPKLIDVFLPKVEELVESVPRHGSARTRCIDRRLQAMGFTGTERTTRRAVRGGEDWRGGRGGGGRFGRGCRSRGCGCSSIGVTGPRVGGRRDAVVLRLVVVVTVSGGDPDVGSDDGHVWSSCVDATLRRIGGAPTYLLSDNAKTVTVEHVAGIAVRHPVMVAAGRHYGCNGGVV